jgi:hypothetical protein
VTVPRVLIYHARAVVAYLITTAPPGAALPLRQIHFFFHSAHLGRSGCRWLAPGYEQNFWNAVVAGQPVRSSVAVDMLGCHSNLKIRKGEHEVYADGQLSIVKSAQCGPCAAAQGGNTMADIQVTEINASTGLPLLRRFVRAGIT